MHIIIGVLGSIVAIPWLLHRLAEMGIGLGGLNPWLWKRRRIWRKNYEANPIYSIGSPMDAAGILATAVAKADGEMSSVEKGNLLLAFEAEFKLSKRDAAGLLSSSAHLSGNGDEIRSDLKGVLEPSREAFTEEQISSTIESRRRMSTADGEPTESQPSIFRDSETVFWGQDGSQKRMGVTGITGDAWDTCPARRADLGWFSSRSPQAPMEHP